MDEQSGRVGVDSVDRITLMENHDQAYDVWRDTGLENQVLIHIDAHHDLLWTEEAESRTIASFISPALQDGFIREVFWVVPDPTWRTVKGRQAVLSHVRQIVESHPEGCQPIREQTDGIVTSILGKALTICTLDSLPPMHERVALDIDVDFLVIPLISYGGVDAHAALPWLWPGDLISRLKAVKLRAHVATIAYSVDGGYTPLKWKYLGVELAARLREPTSREALIGVELMRDATLSAHRHDVVAAERDFVRAAVVWPSSAAPDYHLAHLYEGAGRIEDGRRLYRRAVEKDPSYRTLYGDSGFNHYRAGRLADAEQAFGRTLALDPEHAGALLGLGMVAARQRRWNEAETLLRKSLAIDDELIDAHRQLAALLARREEVDAAISAYQRSLTVAMAGRRPLGALFPSHRPGVHLLDPGHWTTHARLGRLYERKGDLKRAIASYRMSLAAGVGGKALQRRLARLCHQHEAVSE